MADGRSRRRLHLLRHAMPDPAPHLPPSVWALATQGRHAAITIGRRVPKGVRVLSSAERKAIQTARLATGQEPRQDSRFGEVAKPGEPYGSPFRERRGPWVRGDPDERHRGWETPVDAARRFSQAVEDHPDDDLLIATHGMVMVAWLVSIGRLHAGRAAEEYWAALTFPDLVTVEIRGVAQ